MKRAREGARECKARAQVCAEVRVGLPVCMSEGIVPSAVAKSSSPQS